MNEQGDELATTTSLCPTCLEPVPGRYEARDGAVYLSRSCPDHGDASRKVWGSLDHWEWADDVGPNPDGDPTVDPPVDPAVDPTGDPAVDPTGDSAVDPTGDPPADSMVHSANEPPQSTDFTVDNSHACLAVVEVTRDCNLSCSYCFASSGPGGRELPFDEVVQLLDVVRESGGPRPVQFSGGEPTVSDDLPELVERAGDMGFEHVQVNTNGIRLAHEDGYADRLAAAGVTAIYLQFDGLERETYRAIREADILEEKHRAIEACRRADLPVILVPTVVPDTNDHEMGPILEFALDNLDVVASVNFQPVAHFGRYAENNGRFAIDEAARRVADQVPDLDPRDFLPVPCCSSYCQLATVVKPDDGGGLVPLTRFLELDSVGSLSTVVDEADFVELLAGTPIGRDRACSAAGCCGLDTPEGTTGGTTGWITGGVSGMLDSVLPVAISGFVDADAADVGRLGNCCISVPTPSGELVPFCAYNMTTADGRYAIRNRHGWGGRSTVDAADVDATEASRGGDDD